LFGCCCRFGGLGKGRRRGRLGHHEQVDASCGAGDWLGGLGRGAGVVGDDGLGLAPDRHLGQSLPCVRCSTDRGHWHIDDTGGPSGRDLDLGGLGVSIGYCRDRHKQIGLGCGTRGRGRNRGRNGLREDKGRHLGLVLGLDLELLAGAEQVGEEAAGSLGVVLVVGRGRGARVRRLGIEERVYDLILLGL